MWQGATGEVVSAGGLAEEGKVKLPFWAWRGKDVGSAGPRLGPLWD